jgi:hypothetical protein
MHERIRQRIEALEAERGLRGPVPHIVSITFPGMEMTVADGPGGFICRRLADESLTDFELRAEAECRAFNPYPRIPPILIFGGDRDAQR